MNNENIRKAKNFEELLDLKYGTVGTEKRDNFEEKAKYFVMNEMLKRSFCLILIMQSYVRMRF